jgi:hypothetical protein
MFFSKIKINMGEIASQSPVKLLGIIIFLIFVVELLLMVIFHIFSPSISPMAEIILDATLLVLLLFLCFTFIWRPLIISINAKAQKRL